MYFPCGSSGLLQDFLSWNLKFFSIFSSVENKSFQVILLEGYWDVATVMSTTENYLA